MGMTLQFDDSESMTIGAGLVWRGPCRAFGEIRRALAKAAGVPLDLMEGFYRGPTKSILAQHPLETRERTFSVELGIFEAVELMAEWCPISWGRFSDDPVHLFLRQRDIEMEILPADAIRIAERLEELSDRTPNHHGEEILKIAAGLRAAHKANRLVTSSG